MKPTYLGIDLETTGLDETRDRIIEIGVLVLGESLEEIGAWSSTVAAPVVAIDRMPAEVVDMHLATGLAVRTSAGLMITGDRLALSAVEQKLCEIAAYFPERPILFGHSVGFDRGFLRHWCPDFEARLNHQQLDARVAQLLAPDLAWPERAGEKHRALVDIRYSAAVLRYAAARLVGGAA